MIFAAAEKGRADMARWIRRGESIYIPFLNGDAVLDSQNRPRTYKSVEQFKKCYPGFRLEKPDLVEYAPVVHAKWIIDEDGYCAKKAHCSACGENAVENVYTAHEHGFCGDCCHAIITDCCPHCGAKMDLEESNG